MTPAPLLLLAGLGLAASLALGWRRPRLALGLTFAAGALGLAAAGSVLLGGATWEGRSPLPLAGERPSWRLDGLSAWFLALLCVVGAAGAAYAREYWSDRHFPHSAPPGRLWWSAILLSMGLVLLSTNGLLFLVAWELFALSSYFLITLERRSREVRAAGWLYLAASHAGTLCLFALFAKLAAHTGTWELGSWRDHPELAPWFWLALVAFGIKAGLFPLHVWLPSAHANAPSHVSALMSGVTIKLGVYGLLRFTGWLPVPAAAGWTLVILGAVSALVGIAFALAQNDLKRLLAYCSVENVGVITLGLGGALLALARDDAPWGRLLLAGALLHVWNHGLFKALLFLTAGSVVHATGTREMSRLGGLWRTLPWTAALFALGAGAVSALPPLNGFVSEWLVYLGLFEATLDRQPSAWWALLSVITLAMAGALALASFLKAGAMVFLGTPRTALRPAPEGGPWMRGPMLALAGGCLALGLAPLLAWPAVARAAHAWRPDLPAALPPVPLATLSGVQVAIALLFAGGGWWLWRRARANGLRRAPTWDCGYAQPTARMQYTSGSFAQLATDWFAWLLRPERQVRRPHGPFPPRSRFLERTPDTVLERVLVPISAALLRGASVVRRLQHGRLQFYLVYLAAGLLGLALIVWWGETP